MSLQTLADALPDYAHDLAQNLARLEAEGVLTEQQKWGAFVAAANAVSTPVVLQAIEAAAAKAGLSAQAMKAAKAAAAIMGMNNVYFRTLHTLHNPEYRALPSRLRMGVMSDPGVPKADFELWELTVSAIHNCEACLNAHEPALKAMGVPALAIQAALRIAAVTHAVTRVMAAEVATSLPTGRVGEA